MKKTVQSKMTRYVRKTKERKKNKMNKGGRRDSGRSKFQRMKWVREKQLPRCGEPAEWHRVRPEKYTICRESLSEKIESGHNPAKRASADMGKTMEKISAPHGEKHNSRLNIRQITARGRPKDANNPFRADQAVTFAWVPGEQKRES